MYHAYAYLSKNSSLNKITLIFSYIIFYKFFSLGSTFKLK